MILPKFTRILRARESRFGKLLNFNAMRRQCLRYRSGFKPTVCGEVLHSWANGSKSSGRKWKSGGSYLDKKGAKKGRGKEAGPALKSPIGILGSLPSDAGIHGTPKTKVNLLKLNDPDGKLRVKNPQAPQKIPPRQVVLAARSTSGHYNLFLEENPN